MRIGIFPGSFNPVHIGHLAVANYVAEYEAYDEIWFMVTPQNPLKKKADLLDQNLRLKLVEESIAGYEKFRTCTLEWEMPQPTYTINTLQRLRMMYPQDTFELIIGSDNWNTFHRWKDYQIILKNFRTLVYPRKGSDRGLEMTHPKVRFCQGAPRIEISSSFIRKAILEGKDMRFFMPAGLYEKVVASGELTLPEAENEVNTSEK